MGDGQGQGEQKSVMRGFSPDFVAQAWDLDEASVEKLLGSQNGAVLVLVDESVTMPEPTDEVAIAKSYGEFVYNCEDAKKDVDVKNGGRVAVLTSDNLPILKHIRLGADLVKLDQVTDFSFHATVKIVDMELVGSHPLTLDSL